MTIWIANTTRQEMEVHVRVPEMGRVFVRKISSGKQDEIKDLSPGQEEAFIEHITRYGAVRRADLHGKAKAFQGMAYSTDKPFNMEEFHYGLEEVIDHAENRSVTEAVRSAVAADAHMVDKSTGQRLSQSTEMEMMEEHVSKGKKGKKMKITVDPQINNSDSIPLQ